MVVRVILDSNFLMLFSMFSDVFEELEKTLDRKTEKIVLQPIYEELQQIAHSASSIRIKKQAEMVINAIDTVNSLKLIDVNLQPLETVDDLIIRMAREWRCLVATNDRELRRRLIKMGLPVVYLRQRKRLEIQGEKY